MTPTTSTARDPSTRGLTRSQWRVISLASLGGSLEYYDFIIYGIFAQYIARQGRHHRDRGAALLRDLGLGRAAAARNLAPGARHLPRR